ncbi:T9SS type A sorting domain-containing protein [Flavobacteriaceae bacterium]|nr:T9SS type A sorting domain-containing protein [Flavobacteriaceae bacterium]
MKKYLSLYLLVLPYVTNSQTRLTADGQGNTYDLIKSVLAPGYNPIEVPDCNHSDFGNHIDEVFDSTLNTNVFRFYIHSTPDNDRCIKFDRQRNEIKTYDKSPSDLKGTQGEIVVYKWGFKLENGFQSSPNFTHIHQLKSVGGALESMPMYTLTTRKGSPDKIQIRYAETDAQVTLYETELSPFIGTWLEVIETITYDTKGTYSIEIKSASDDSVLLNYFNNDIINWRNGASFVRPKWGIYRSLINAQDLRDEVVSFSYFSIEEIDSLTEFSMNTLQSNLTLYPNPVNDFLYIKNNFNQQIELQLQVYTLTGQLLMESLVSNKNLPAVINTSKLANGTYIIELVGPKLKSHQLIVVSH